MQLLPPVLSGVHPYLVGNYEGVFGQKATNLMRLTELMEALPFQVPPGIAIPSDYLNHLYSRTDDRYLNIARTVRMKLGAWLAVRSSPEVSHPGLLETVVMVPNGDDRALYEAIVKVRQSWDSEPAVAFRKLYRLKDDFAMGLVIQDYIEPTADSWAGVYFTRNPRTGSARGIIESVHAQPGSELVGGTMDPTPLPEMYQQGLRALGPQLEKVFGGPLDLEYVFRGEECFLVQARHLRHLTPAAAARAAREMISHGVLTPEQGEALVNRRDSKAPWWLEVSEGKVVGHGLGAVSGAARGIVAITRNFGPNSIYVGGYTATEHMQDMLACKGILTNTGGQTCHAAILAMQAGKPSVVGADFIIEGDRIAFADENQNYTVRFHEGDLIVIDGGSGLVYGADARIEDARAEWPVLPSLTTSKDEDDDLAGAGDAVPYTDEEMEGLDDEDPDDELAYEHLR